MDRIEEFFKVKTGIPGLDQMTNGGFKRGSIVTVSGGTGTGRTTFAMQFLVRGALDFHEPGLYLSFDEHRTSVFANMRAYGWDLAAMERNRELVFIEYPPGELEMFLEQDESIRDLIDEVGVDRVVLDTITPFALHYPNEDERRQAVFKLVEKMRRWNCTVLVVSEDSGELVHGVPKTRSGVEAFCDGFLHLTNRVEGKERKRFLEILKLRGVPHDNQQKEFLMGKHGVRIAGAKDEAPPGTEEPEELPEQRVVHGKPATPSHRLPPAKPNAHPPASRQPAHHPGSGKHAHPSRPPARSPPPTPKYSGADPLAARAAQRAQELEALLKKHRERFGTNDEREETSPQRQQPTIPRPPSRAPVRDASSPLQISNHAPPRPPEHRAAEPGQHSTGAARPPRIPPQTPAAQDRDQEDSPSDTDSSQGSSFTFTFGSPKKKKDEEER